MLPLCMRIGPAQHDEQRQSLREMPIEDSIHLCLMADGPPTPGDDAFELCRYLAGPRVRRKHVSVVAGGWPAVEELARELKLDLMPTDTDQLKADAKDKTDGFQQTRAAIKQIA